MVIQLDYDKHLLLRFSIRTDFELAHCSLWGGVLDGMMLLNTKEPLMELTFKQLNLLSIALTVFYDEVCKTGTTPGMKKDIMELSKLVNDEFSKISV